MPIKNLPAIWNEVMFWFAVIGAATFKALTTEPRTIWGALAAWSSAIFSALIFAEPIAAYLKFEGTSAFAVAALVALTGEHAMRLAIRVAKNPSEGFKLWRNWRKGV